MRRKRLAAPELEAYRCLAELGLDSITVPGRIEDGVLISDPALPVQRLELDVVRLFDECLSGMYRIRHDTCSPGMYAHFGHTAETPTANRYFTNLSQEVRAAEHTCGPVMPALEAVFAKHQRRFWSSMGRQSPALPSGFVLLHGDLYSGNILTLNGAYKLIDFEHMRFGPVEIELGFLLCWDLLTNQSLSGVAAQTVSRDLGRLVDSHAITEESAGLIVDIFMPMFVVLACLYASAGRFRDTQRLTKGLQVFGEIDLTC